MQAEPHQPQIDYDFFDKLNQKNLEDNIDAQLESYEYVHADDVRRLIGAATLRDTHYTDIIYDYDITTESREALLRTQKLLHTIPGEEAADLATRLDDIIDLVSRMPD